MFLVSTRLVLIASRYLVEGYIRDERVSVPDIALRYNMNARAIMPALRRLTQAGLLTSQTGGINPGFAFARDPKTISLLDIINVLEGRKNMDCCINVISTVSCDLMDCSKCLVHSKLNNSLDEMRNALSGVSVYEHYLVK